MLSLALLACAPPPLPVVDTTPSIAITWPPPESDETGCETVAVSVTNFTLVEFPNTDGIVANEGHYHIYFPGDYQACYKPYCFIDFSDVTDFTDPYITAVLAYNEHTEVTDANGDRVEAQIPINFIPGPCAATADDETHEYDTGDTGGGDSGH